MAPSDRSTTVLGDWFATAMLWRPQVAMFVNTRTLLPVFVPLAPGATLYKRAPDAIAAVLARHGVDDEVIAAELAEMREVRLGPTNDRSIVGVMNEFTRFAEFSVDDGITDLEELSMRVSRVIIGPLMKGSGSPDRELAAFFGTGDRNGGSDGGDDLDPQLPSNVIPFPGTYRPDHPSTSNQAPVHPSTSNQAPARTPARRVNRLPGGVYQLKITIKGIKPPVWRRVLVDGSATFGELHEVIQAAFGWWNYHLYEFEIGGNRYGVPDPDDDWGTPTIDASDVRIDSLLVDNASFDYTYDFGDGWVHRIVVEKVVSTVEVPVPACIAGRRAGPPEDCGGPWGYQHLLEILADPAHPEHRERVEWIGRPFDPEAFDKDEFEHELHQVRTNVFDD